MLLFILISCLSFLLVSQTIFVQPLMLWLRRCGKSRMNCLPIWCSGGLSQLLFDFINTRRLVKDSSSASMCLKGNSHQKLEKMEEPTTSYSLLDLPDLALEAILSRLSPASLCRMAAVCTDLRERCSSDRLWEMQLNKKWGKLVGSAAHKEWQRSVAMNKEQGILDSYKSKHWLGSLACLWPISWLRSRHDFGKRGTSSIPCDSVMAWYRSLESGKFLFPAQVYNREHGHVGFMLSCYDAEVSYNSATDTFQARYPPHGHRTIVIEDGIHWDRLRSPPIDTTAHDLHNSDCLNDLYPGDKVEIQWRRNKEFPYGWWYGVIGHHDSCGGHSRHCCCHLNDTVILEFNQYTPGSRWRRAVINRRGHHEEGNELEGFYGGVRKLKSKEEISTWKQMWPSEILE